jgi:hypothetical protein
MFELIDNQSHCCPASSQMRVLATTLPTNQRASRIPTLSKRDGRSRERCEAACAEAPECRFFSYAEHVGRVAAECTLCIACDLERLPHARFRTFGHARAAARRRVRLKALSDDAELSSVLQGRYSERLYGMPGRVELSSLRLLWLDLLPRRALESLARVGVCNLDARPPFQPFFYAHDVVNNPRDAVWVHRPEDDLPARPLRNFSWVEVTHCPRPKHISAMWLYAAPGSGVSINIGRSARMGVELEASRQLESNWRVASAGVELEGRIS